MATQRYISTGFWDDEWVQELDPSEKLMYMYLLTNPLTTISGVYKITLRRMSFDTGFNIETVSRILAKFKAAKKSYHFEEYTILPSWPKHQQWEKRDTIRKGIDAEIKKLPENVREYMSRVSYAYPTGSYTCPTGSHAYDQSYPDTDTDTDIDLDTDIDIEIDKDDSFSSSVEIEKEDDDDAIFAPSPIHRLESALATWNSDASLPRYRFLPIAMPEQARGAALRTLGAYTDAEVKTAIANYSKILQNPSAWEAFPKYTGFQGFMASGVEQYADEARPFERCKVKPKAGEHIDPDRDEKMRKAAQRAKDFMRDDDEEEVRVDMTAIMNSLTNGKRVTA